MSGAGVHLNRKLILEQSVRLPDGAGGYSESWVQLGLIWGAIKAGSGRETSQDFLTVSRVPHRITVRAAPYGAPSRPKPEQRFIEGTRIFRILAVADLDEDGRYLVCHAIEEEVSS